MRKEELNIPDKNNFANILLSPREYNIIELLAQGCKSQRIADILDLSVRTIDWYRNRLAKKFNVPGGAALVSVAVNYMAYIAKESK